MGADLITYMLVGPETVHPTAAKRQSMLKRAEKLVDRAQDANDRGDGLDGYDEFETEHLAGLDPKKTLADFLQLWNDGSFCRDANWRTFEAGKKTYKVLVAGEMSWGDEPDGHGYQTMKAADALGYLKPLGIQ